jgi:hypothetical protein
MRRWPSRWGAGGRVESRTPGAAVIVFGSKCKPHAACRGHRVPVRALAPVLDPHRSDTAQRRVSIRVDQYGAPRTRNCER